MCKVYLPNKKLFLSGLLIAALFMADCQATELRDALDKVRQNPKNYQVHLYDLLDKDVYCNISRFTADKALGSIVMDFNYRGGTIATLTDFDEERREVHGIYPISFPIVGTSDVKITLRFNRDGTAHGEWRNKGFSGAFDILNRYR
jgi:hypothetical protein